MHIASAVLVMLVASASAYSATPSLPIRSGTYQFWHRDAEFPQSRGFRITITVRGREITVVNRERNRPVPVGVIEQGTLMWHAASGQWIVAHSDADGHAAEVGGCSGGPNVIDFAKKILWTCEGGP